MSGRAGCAFAIAALLAVPAGAQIVESVGSRAQGMGGAFVAVANDSSATWWNPAGLADGPFFEMALARSVTDRAGDPPMSRERLSSLAVGIPPAGLSYYRFRITDIQPAGPTEPARADRQEGGVAGPVRSLVASQMGVTLLQTVSQGVHVGTTVRYLRGTLRTDPRAGVVPVAGLLDRGEALDGGDTEQRVDLDVGVLAIAGPLRIGGVGRNLRAPVFGSGAVTLPRQVRLGAAFDASRIGGPPLMIAVDADLKAYALPAGPRRVIALGGEQWIMARRIGLRAGARFNRVGAGERSATAGVSVSLRPGWYLDGHVVRGGAADERGWGAAARASF